jgi:hypothetical protein
VIGYKLKKAQVTPLHKKNDPLLKTSYRPVSVLCILSKIFDKILEQQLSDFFENIFNSYLCAFRTGIPSAPVAFLMLILFIIFSTLSVVTFSKTILFVQSFCLEKKPLPCMNQELRRATYRKQMLYSQFTKCQSNKNWEKFRKQRNFVTKSKRKSFLFDLVTKFLCFLNFSQFLLL